MAVTASQTSREIDWYVITDEADLTLRIANGLRVGEDRWGELTLNHPVAAHRWLEFTIDEDGQLSCRPSRRDIVIELDGVPQEQLLLNSGDPIELPHNRVHISDSFKRGPSDATPAVVRCVEVDQSATPAESKLARVVITESDVETSAPEVPVLNNTVAAKVADRMADKMAERMADRRALNLAGPAQPERRDEHGNERIDDSIETALIPVDAESPFAVSEVSDVLRRPIQVPEQQNMRGAANSPVMTPALTHTAPAERRSYTYLWALSAILGCGILAAIFTAINSAPGTPMRPGNLGAPVVAATPSEAPTRTEELLTSVQNILSRSETDDPAAWEFAVRSYEYILAQEPGNDLVRRRLNAARSKVASLAATGIASQPQSSTPTPIADPAPPTALASEPATNPAATSGTPTTTAFENATPVETVTNADAPTVETAAPTTVTPTQPFILDTEVTATTAPTGAVAGDTTVDSGITLPFAATVNVEPLNEEQIASRLRIAAARLADGQIVAPRGSSASALILSVLAVDPTHREAINLLNASADVMVARAEQSYANSNTFGARNTLEEALAFHPRHRLANERWQQWTGSESRYR